MHDHETLPPTASRPVRSDLSTHPSSTADGELTRAVLSTEASRLRDGLGLPIRLLPLPREGTHGALREYTLGLNHLIAGERAHPRVWSFIERHLPPGCAAPFDPLFRARFHPLWNREELADLRERAPADFAAEWRRRIARTPWSCLDNVLCMDRDFSAVWRDLAIGDFDISGRGRDYTTGMEYFQAARAYGIECLLELLGLHGSLGGFYLDVLGGDGYIMRLLEASRAMRQKRVFVIPVAHTSLAGAEPVDSSMVDILLQRIREAVEGVLVLLVTPLQTEGAGRAARLLGIHAEGLVTGVPFELSQHELHALLDERSVSWLGERPLTSGLAAILRRTADYLANAVGPGRAPVMITNDISPHMFYSAGLWGFPTREDARRLSRTFRAGALDGVLFAYGTHHVAELGAAIRESLTVLRPGGRIVVHDFLDEGQVGRWFHDVVDKRSRTGHNFQHLGPIQAATSLYLAGFRNVELYEMEDPFVFGVPEGNPESARDVACTYLLGMYGMNESFAGHLDLFEEVVHEILSYPEIGNKPHFSRDLVYIPRRATIVSGQRPMGGADEPLSDRDAALAHKLTELLINTPDETALERITPPDVLKSWFAPDGSRWGVSPVEQKAWLAWHKRMACL